MNLTYGIIRTSYRDGYDRVAFTRRNTPYLYDIKLNPVGCRFLKGQRIRLYVSSSDFPNLRPQPQHWQSLLLRYGVASGASEGVSHRGDGFVFGVAGGGVGVQSHQNLATLNSLSPFIIKITYTNLTNTVFNHARNHPI